MAFVLVVSLLLIALNGLFVLVEFALVKVRGSRLEVLARRGDPRAPLVQAIQADLDDYLAAIQMGITVVALALGWIAEPTLAHWVEGLLLDLHPAMPRQVLLGLSFALALGLLSWAHIVFGELIPRSIGIQRPDVVSLWGAIPLRVFYLAFRIPVAFMSACSTTALKLLGMKRAAQSESVVPEDEMRILIGETQEKGSLPLERLILLENLFDIGQTKVSEVMVPREKVVCLSLKTPWAQNLEIIKSKRLTRYPLCEDGIDSVIGLLHVKDLVVRADEAEPDLRRLRRDLAEVKDSEPLEKLLKSFPDKGIQMALVRDAQGRAAGLLTFEDIVEELVGEVHDEFDLPEAWSLAGMVVPQAVAVGVEAPDRRAAIILLMGKLVAAVPELKEAEALAAVWDREMKFSSAVGRGVAVPHGRLPGLERPMIALGRFAKPIPFPSPDNAPVRLLFLILTPAGTPVLQLKILGRIASLVTNENLRRKLFRAKTAESLLEILRTADTMLAG